MICIAFPWNYRELQVQDCDTEVIQYIISVYHSCLNWIEIFETGIQMPFGSGRFDGIEQPTSPDFFLPSKSANNVMMVDEISSSLTNCSPPETNSSPLKICLLSQKTMKVFIFHGIFVRPLLAEKMREVLNHLTPSGKKTQYKDIQNQGPQTGNPVGLKRQFCLARITERKFRSCLYKIPQYQ